MSASRPCRPLREVVSWNFRPIGWSPLGPVSTSSWGRELKWRHRRKAFLRRNSRPLREVVSWNGITAYPTTSVPGRPLREVVSWNTSAESENISESSSTSSWGRELKYAPTGDNMVLHPVDLFVRSWVEMITSYRLPQKRQVDLFVRSWVEINSIRRPEATTMSTSSWGRELKYCRFLLLIFLKIVDLFVRSWVEISVSAVWARRWDVDLFVRSWVEMNLLELYAKLSLVDLFVRSWVEMWESGGKDFIETGSTSSWGRELKW